MFDHLFGHCPTLLRLRGPWLNLSRLYPSWRDLSKLDLHWLDLPWLDLSRLDLSWLDLSWLDLLCSDLACPHTPCRNLPDTFQTPNRYTADTLQTPIKHLQNIRHVWPFLPVKVRCGLLLFLLWHGKTKLTSTLTNLSWIRSASSKWSLTKKNAFKKNTLFYKIGAKRSRQHREKKHRPCVLCQWTSPLTPLQYTCKVLH